MFLLLLRDVPPQTLVAAVLSVTPRALVAAAPSATRVQSVISRRLVLSAAKRLAAKNNSKCRIIIKNASSRDEAFFVPESIRTERCLSPRY